MKTLFVFIFLYFPTILLAQTDFQLNDETVAWIYESRADIKTPDHKLAGIISTDYANARDEFTRHDLMQQIKPVLDKRIGTAQAIDTVQIKVRTRLEEYDFEKAAFPTGFSKETFIPLGDRYGYSVVFDNGEFLAMLPVELDSARSLSDSLRNNRTANLTITGNIVGVKEDRLRYQKRKIVIVKATSMDVNLHNGEKVGSKANTAN